MLTLHRSSGIRHLAGLAALLLPAVAQAHAGHPHGPAWFSGLAHPWSGIDHLLALVCVGAWAAQRPGRAALPIPMAFLGAMLIGAAVAGPWLSVVAVEGGIASTVVLLGLLLACALRPRNDISCALVACAALFHGLAHGLEAPAGLPAAYIAGFFTSSALLLGGGLLGARWLQHLHWQKLLRLAGAGVAFTGVLLLA